MRSITLKDKRQIVLNSDIELGEQEGNGKGRYFMSRFIEPGIAHYEELGDILITKETLNKFIQTMVGVPVIIDHEDVTDKNVDKLRVGTVSKVWFNEFDGYFYCEGILTDKDAVDLVKNKGWNVSCAYSFVADETKKQHNGKDIDMEFTDGEFLHLAIVKNPRYEGANIVVNSNEIVQDKGDIFDEYFDNQNKVENSNKENIIMQVLNELKEFIKNVVSNEKDEEMAVKNEDKRKLIDEIGGILKGKVDDEIIRTVIKKAEELSYEPSEDDKADNKAKNEDEKEDKEEAKNKCKNEDDKEEDKKADNEDDEEDDEDVTKNEDDDEEKTENKKVKNSMKDIVMGGKGQVQEQKLYISRKERLEEGNKY